MLTSIFIKKKCVYIYKQQKEIQIYMKYYKIIENRIRKHQQIWLTRIK